MKHLTRLALAICFFVLLSACGQPVDVGEQGMSGLRFNTADPNLTITFLIPGNYTCVNPMIKGNIGSGDRHLYHEPGMPNYNQVVINEQEGELWFCTVEEAETAGWVRAGN